LDLDSRKEAAYRYTTITLNFCRKILYFNLKKGPSLLENEIDNRNSCLLAHLIELGFIIYLWYKCAGKRGFTTTSSGLARVMLSFMMYSLDGKLQLKP